MCQIIYTVVDINVYRRQMAHIEISLSLDQLFVSCCWSGVGDAIDLLIWSWVLAELSLVNGLEVTCQALCLDRVHNWRAFFNSFRWMSLDEAEVFEILWVSRLEVEVCRDVAAELEIVRVSVGVEQFLHAFEFLALPLREIVFVCRSSVERQRVVRVLRFLLMEDVILAIVPVWECCVVWARFLDWLRWFNNLVHFSRSSFTLFSAELAFIRRCHVHLVRVDDLALLLEIKGLLVGFNLGLCQLSVVVLAVVWEKRFWVWVPHESIRASSESRAIVLVASWQWIV